MPDEADEFCLPEEREALAEDAPEEREALAEDAPEEREALAEDAPEEREALAEDADEFCPSEEPEAPKEELLISQHILCGKTF